MAKALASAEKDMAENTELEKTAKGIRQICENLVQTAIVVRRLRNTFLLDDCRQVKVTEA